jgi:hypothetical protein
MVFYVLKVAVLKKNKPYGNMFLCVSATGSEWLPGREVRAGARRAAGQLGPPGNQHHLVSTSRSHQ